jgi:arsenite methyltransferase
MLLKHKRATIGLKNANVHDSDCPPQEIVYCASYVGCIAGALSRAEYLDGLAAAGFAGASVTFTHQAASGMHAAIIRAVKPAR